MYSASNAFHTAVAQGKHQIALLIFDDAVFTNDDIDVQRGIEFNDYFNMNEDISIGQALSNEISFSIFNDSGLLDNYAFGDFTATIGVETGNQSITTNGTVYVQSASHTYITKNTSPYLVRDDSSSITQPTSPIVSILIYDGIVYCGLQNGSVKMYNDSNGSVYSGSINSFMTAQLQKWKTKGIFYNKSTRILKIWQNDEFTYSSPKKLRTYEFVPLGRFTAERPNVPTVNEIDFTCYDFMQKFEKDMPSASTLNMTYPATISTLFTKMCSNVGVSYESNSFINSSATIHEEPDDFENVTMREVLQWIAEAAASNARFDRDGILKMDWIRSTNQVISETGYSEFGPYWYQTKKVTKLYNRSSDGEYENTTGSGSEGYLIQDNPLLEEVT